MVKRETSPKKSQKNKKDLARNSLKKKPCCVEEMDPDRIVYSAKELLKIKGAWFLHRPYIEEGHRFCPKMSVARCSSTMWMCNHNEVTNIWSHLLGALYFIYQLVLIVTKSGAYSQFEL